MNIKSFMKTTAFSLIELMVVIAIVALLAAIATPTYKTYLSRSKASEINGLVQAMMAATAAAYSNGSSNPTTVSPGTGDTSFLAINGSYSTSTLQVWVTFGPSNSFDTTNIGGSGGVLALWFSGTDSSGVITWSCTFTLTAPYAGYMSSTANPPTAHATNASTVAGFNYFAVNGTSCT